MSDPNDRTQVRSMGGRAQASLAHLKRRYDWGEDRGKAGKLDVPKLVVIQSDTGSEWWRMTGPADGDATMYELLPREEP